MPEEVFRLTDEIIVLAPFFPEYRVIFDASGAQVKPVADDEDNFQINFDELEKTISEHIVAVVVN